MDIPYWIKCRVFPRHQHHIVRTGLEPGWHDTDERILYACMSLLCEYVEVEQGGEDGFPNVASVSPDTDAEALAIYRWWKHERPANHAALDVMLMTPPPIQKSEREYDAYRKYEDQIEAQDNEMLHRLIDIRATLWS